MGKQSKKGGGGNAHDRAVARVTGTTYDEMKNRFNSPIRNKVSMTSKSRMVRLVNFLEHPWFLLPIGIVGSAVGLSFYTPALIVLPLCFAGAFHRAKVVQGCSWKIQIPSYFLVIMVAVFIAWLAVITAQKAVHDSVKAIATEIHTMTRPTPPPPDPNYPPSENPLVRMEGRVEQPSQTMCQGLSGDEQVKCLCPNPLSYELIALPSPKDNNYSTLLDVKRIERPFYRIRVFARTQITARYGYTLLPAINAHSSASLTSFDYDPYSFVLTSTQSEEEFKIEIHSAEGLRLYCINQEN